MVTLYIKGADRCMFTHIHLRAGWYVSLACRLVCITCMHYAHLRNVLLQLTTGPLVAIAIEELTLGYDDLYVVHW